jgi:hypothetical protein
MFVAAIAVPDAFGSHGVLFGMAFLIVTVMHLTLYTLSARRDLGWTARVRNHLVARSPRANARAPSAGRLMMRVTQCSCHRAREAIPPQRSSRLLPKTHVTCRRSGCCSCSHSTTDPP